MEDILDLFEITIRKNINQCLENKSNIPLKQYINEEKISSQFMEIIDREEIQEYPENDLKENVIRLDYGEFQDSYSSNVKNIRINLKKILLTFSGHSLAVNTIVENPWTLPFAAYLFFITFKDCLKISLSYNEAILIWNLWIIRNTQNYVSQSEFENVVLPKLKSEYGLGKDDLVKSLHHLQKMNCIKLDIDKNKYIFLFEKVELEFK